MQRRNAVLIGIVNRSALVQEKLHQFNGLVFRVLERETFCPAHARGDHQRSTLIECSDEWIGAVSQQKAYDSEIAAERRA